MGICPSIFSPLSLLFLHLFSWQIYLCKGGKKDLGLVYCAQHGFTFSSSAQYFLFLCCGMKVSQGFPYSCPPKTRLLHQQWNAYIPSRILAELPLAISWVPPALSCMELWFLGVLYSLLPGKYPYTFLPFSQTGTHNCSLQLFFPVPRFTQFQSNSPRLLSPLLG